MTRLLLPAPFAPWLLQQPVERSRWCDVTAPMVSANPESSRDQVTKLPKLECLDDVIAAQGGDLEAAARLIERYQARIAGYVYAIVLNPSDLDDVTQNVFVKMCARLATLRQPELFEPWLYQLARRTSLDFLRRHRFRKFWCSLEAVFHLPAPEPASFHVRGAGADEVQQVLARLSARDRQIIVLASEGHTYAEVAQLLGASRASIKARLARVREWMREELKPTSP